MSFKTLDLAHDVASIVSAINEVVSISSATFITGSGDVNVKYYTNIASSSVALGGYWETVYDADPTVASSTALFDISFGYSTASVFNVEGSVSSSQDEKIKVYRQIANVLMGGPDKTFEIASAAKNECFFILMKRGLMKDEIKKGSVSLILNQGAVFVTASDAGAATNFKQTVGGDYAPLFSGTTEIGQVWYTAGIIVIPASASAGLPWATGSAWSGSLTLSESMADKAIDLMVDGFRGHLKKVDFHNQTNLYSTVYFCRATNTEFNYSSNPTFVDDDKRIRVTSGSNILQTRTYITTIGMYDANDNLLAVGKLNKPITKSPDTEAIFRIRLDY
jgi:hypothetical protein